MRTLLQRCLLCGLIVACTACGKGKGIPKPPSSPPRPVTYLTLSLSVVPVDEPEVLLLDEPLALF